MISYDSIAWYCMFYDVGFGAQAVSRKTPIYFIYTLEETLVSEVETVAEPRSKQRSKKSYRVAGMFGAANFPAGQGRKSTGRGKGENPRGEAGQKSAQIEVVNEVFVVFYEGKHYILSFLASQSDAHTIAPHRDPNPNPNPSIPLIALKQE